MAIEQRLPMVNADDGVWGDDLNAFLGKEHYNADVTLTPGTSTNGMHKTVTIRPGTMVALTAPLKFTAGPTMTVAEAGAVEFNSDKLYITTSTPTRRTIATYDDNTGAQGDMYYRDSSGNFVKLAIGGNNYTLTSNGTTPTWTAPGATGLSQQQVMAISSMRM